jgi:GDP-L-fucose synthase
MSRILITGGNGFVARNLIKGLQEHELTIITRSEFDLRDTDAVNKFFENKSFDYVLHTATSGGSRLKSDDSDVLLDNLTMFYNLLKHKSKYRKFINFGSGAEMDRRTDINLIYPDYKKSFPIDPYGMSKNIIARLIEPLPDFHNIRIFNVFGEDELETRFVKASINHYINKEPIIIHQNKLMDFFYIEDLVELVKYFLNNNLLPKEVNCSYKQKYSLNEVANIINEQDAYEVPIIIENKEWSNCYIGTNIPLSVLQFKKIGLEDGIKKMYKVIKQ